MNLLKKLRLKLTDDRLINIDPDSKEFTEIHHNILSERRYMQDVFKEIYDKIISCDKKYLKGNGITLEIGAGSSFFKKYYPGIITSDIKPTPYTDLVVDALSLPYNDLSVKAIYGIHCFHHFSDPDKFLNELQRALIPGGGCILCDPYYSWFSCKFYSALSDNEFFYKKMTGWKSPVSGPMKGANQALSYIVFKRDIKLFHEKFPELEITYQKPLRNYIRYIISGGLNFKPLLPYGFQHITKFLEWLLYPFIRVFALHHIIVIRKKVM